MYATGSNCNLERVTFHLGGYRTSQGQPSLFVIFAGTEDKRRTSPGLLVARLRIK